MLRERGVLPQFDDLLGIIVARKRFNLKAQPAYAEGGKIHPGKKGRLGNTEKDADPN